MPEPLEITPQALDVARHAWRYPRGEIEPGRPIVIHAPQGDDTEFTHGSDVDEAPVAVLVIAVAPDGRMHYVSHVVGEDMLPSEFVQQHSEMLRQAYGPAGAMIEYSTLKDAAGEPRWERKPDR